jgi:hypothetical protein
VDIVTETTVLGQRMDDHTIVVVGGTPLWQQAIVSGDRGVVFYNASTDATLTTAEVAHFEPAYGFDNITSTLRWRMQHVDNITLLSSVNWTATPTWKLTFAEPLPAAVTELSLINTVKAGITHGSIIRNNVFYDGLCRATILRASGATIHDNVFNHTVVAGIIVSYELFCLGGDLRVENISIADNVFERCGPTPEEPIYIVNTARNTTLSNNTINPSRVETPPLFVEER